MAKVSTDKYISFISNADVFKLKAESENATTTLSKIRECLNEVIRTATEKEIAKKENEFIQIIADLIENGESAKAEINYFLWIVEMNEGADLTIDDELHEMHFEGKETARSLVMIDDSEESIKERRIQECD